MIKIRCSSISSYNDCPRRAAAKNWRSMVEDAGFEVKRQLNGIGAAIGTGVHAVASEIMSAKRDGIKIDGDIIGIGIDIMRNEVAEGVTFDNSTGSISEAETQIKTLSNAFKTTVAKQVNPENIETRRTAISTHYELTGQPDVEGIDGSINDWKFGAKFPIAMGQHGGYSILRRSDGATAPKKCITWHLPRTPKSKQYPGTRSEIYDPIVCEKIAFATISRMQKDVENFLKSGEEFCFPANPMSMMCSEKFCPVYKTKFCKMRGN